MKKSNNVAQKRVPRVEQMLTERIRMQSQELRQRAEQCERLARSTLDVFVREALTELAAELRQQATTGDRRRFLHSSKSGRPKHPKPPSTPARR